MSAPSVRQTRRADHREMSWQNGRGVTVEFAREDDAEGNLLWRLSRADVVEAGDFSRFPGVDRWLMLVEGAGFDLDFGPEHGRVAAQPFVPVRFAGEWPTRAENVRGPSRDLNVMVARGTHAAEIAVHREGFERAAATRSLYLALAGNWQVAIGDETHALAADDLLTLRDMGPALVRADGTGVLVAVDLS